MNHHESTQMLNGGLVCNTRPKKVKELGSKGIVQPKLKVVPNSYATMFFVFQRKTERQFLKNVQTSFSLQHQYMVTTAVKLQKGP